MNFKGQVEKHAVVIQVHTMAEIQGIQAALDGNRPIHYEFQGMRVAPVKGAAAAVVRNGHAAKTLTTKPVVTVVDPAKAGDYAPPAVPVLMKIILDLHNKGRSHSVQDLVEAHLGNRFPQRRGQMANVYVQWVRRAQAARARLEEEHGLSFELRNTGRGREYFGVAKGA